MESTEEWRAVVGFEDYYRVSNRGRVYSIRTDRILSPAMAGLYPAVRLKVGGVGKTMKLHVMVAEAFIGPRPDMGGARVDICHNDNDRTNAAVENLRYDTHQNNQRQMAADGRGNIARTHCKRGHEFTPENTWHHKARGGTTRVCRACHYMRREQQRARSDSGYPQSA